MGKPTFPNEIENLNSYLNTREKKGPEEKTDCSESSSVCL